MRIVHRIGTSKLSAEDRRELASHGVIVPAKENAHAFDIDEASDGWRWVKAWVDRHHAFDMATTEFSNKEISEAPWLVLMPEWHHGYPQPEDDYAAVTYDLQDYCMKCGIGRKQKAPFRMKREPKWGRRGLLQLNWVFDEFFATPEVSKGVFEPFGVASRVVTDPKGRELTSVVQLVVPDQMSLVSGGLPAEASSTCATCGRTKHEPFTRGAFPALACEPRAAMARTSEYFGSGGAADHRVLISQPLCRALTAAKVRGASFWPVAS